MNRGRTPVTNQDLGDPLTPSSRIYQFTPTPKLAVSSLRPVADVALERTRFTPGPLAPNLADHPNMCFNCLLLVAKAGHVAMVCFNQKHRFSANTTGLSSNNLSSKHQTAENIDKGMNC